jgi:hypothetical protein
VYFIDLVSQLHFHSDACLLTRSVGASHTRCTSFASRGSKLLQLLLCHYQVIRDETFPGKVGTDVCQAKRSALCASEMGAYFVHVYSGLYLYRIFASDLDIDRESHFEFHASSCSDVDQRLRHRQWRLLRLGR